MNRALISTEAIKNLMLKYEVVEAIGADQFHVWSVTTIDEGIALLTGIEAGFEGPDGRYPEGSIHELVPAARAVPRGGQPAAGARSWIR